MKKLLIIIELLTALFCFCMDAGAQIAEKWADLDSTNTEKLVLAGKEMDNDSILHAQNADSSIYSDTSIYSNMALNAINSDSSGYADTSIYADTAGYVPFSVDTLDKTFYLSISGSDVTGDGTIVNPYASYGRAIQDLKLNCSNIIITFHTITGSIAFTDADKLDLLSRNFKNVQISFEGEMVMVESGITVSETFTNSMVYNASKGGLTVTEDEYAGMFIDDGNGRYLPIAFNTAGTGTFTLSSMRAARNGSKNVMGNDCIIDISSSSEDILSFDVPGLSKISYDKIHIYNGTNDIDLQFNTVNAEFNFGTKVTVNVIILGNNNDPSLQSIGFTGTFLNLGEVANDINTGNARMNIAMARSVVYAPNVVSNNYAINLGGNSFLRLREMAIVGGDAGSAINVSHNSNVEISKTVLGVNLKAFMGLKFGTCNIFSVISEGWSMLNLVNTEYLLYSDVSNTSYNENINIYINDLQKDGSYLGLIEYPAIHELIDWNKNIFINIPDYDSKIIFKESVIDTIFSDTIPNKAYVDSYFSGSLTDGAPTASEINSITGLTPATAGYNRRLLIFDTDGTGLFYKILSTGSFWIYFPGQAGSTAL